jgi:ankyrin repeat protein
MDEDEIFEASAKGQANRVQELLDSGVDVNHRDFDRNDTPLHFACGT